MTQKSYARRQRDAAAAQLQDNKCWDELNQIYESSRVMLYQHSTIHAMAQNKQLLSCLVDATSTANNIRILTNDLKSMNDQLNAIRAKHAGKFGGSTNPDEVWSSIMIGQEYAQLVETHTAVVQPTVFKILEDFQQAEIRLAEKLRESAAVAMPVDQSNSQTVQ